MALRTVIITTRRAGAIASVVINRGPAGTGTGGPIISETAPVDPIPGMTWYDPADGITAIWDGTVWVGQDFLPIVSAIPPLAFVSPGGEPYRDPIGDYYLSPA